jgi:hypothetical protein
MRAGIVRLSFAVIERLLQLPEGVHIERTFEDPIMYRHKTLSVVISGEALPYDVIDGAILPVLTVQHTKQADGSIVCQIVG